jgi:hypothetical protein
MLGIAISAICIGPLVLVPAVRAALEAPPAPALVAPPAAAPLAMAAAFRRFEAGVGAVAFCLLPLHIACTRRLITYCLGRGSCTTTMPSSSRHDSGQMKRTDDERPSTPPEKCCARGHNARGRGGRSFSCSRGRARAAVVRRWPAKWVIYLRISVLLLVVLITSVNMLAERELIVYIGTAPAAALRVVLPH